MRPILAKIYELNQHKTKIVSKCIFCNCTDNLQSFKSQIVCTDCLQNIRRLYHDGHFHSTNL